MSKTKDSPLTSRGKALAMFPKSAKVIEDHARSEGYHSNPTEIEKVRMQVDMMKDGLVYRMERKLRDYDAAKSNKVSRGTAGEPSVTGSRVQRSTRKY